VTPRRARYSKIERIVAGLLASSAPGVPVPVERMVKDQGIALRKGDLGEVSGLLLRDTSGTTIGVNSTQSSVRQRFTIAHEFGHFMLHEGISEHVDHSYRVNYRSEVSSQATDVDEIEANFFAASLLMPRSMLDEREAAAALDDDRKVRLLAREFDVSQHAMSLRLANLYKQFAPF
jgi:Zn-dependent peptidase ImmA (M78 family)